MQNEPERENHESARRSRTGAKQKPRKFWRISSSIYSAAPGIKFLNEDLLTEVTGSRIFGAPIGRRGFAEYPEPPLLLIDKKLGKPLKDLQSFYDYFLISEKTKSVFESLDPDAFAFCKCETRMPDGTEGPEYWLCDVLPMLDAVDEENSIMDIEIDKNGHKWYGFVGIFDVKIIEDMVSNRKIFRLLYGQYSIFCDESFKLACRGLKGLGFYSLKQGGPQG